MKTRFPIFVALALLLVTGCEKSDVSKIPQISLIAFYPTDSMRVNVDTVYLAFNITDGDGDIGNDTTSVIYLKDNRFEDQGFVKTPFPQIDPSIQDPTKGLQATCIFFPEPKPTPRLDSVHMATGDTFHYEFYIKDRAGNESNHIVTNKMIIRL